jgi:DtxR family Mn-dependent transcriptional regulator
MVQKVTSSMERYLQIIYRLQEKNGVATTGELARKLGVVPGTITNTIKRLKMYGLVEHKPHLGVKLTDTGRRNAFNTVKKHRILSQLLTNILDVEPTLAHNVAFDIVNVIPSVVIRKIEDKLRRTEKEECTGKNLHLVLRLNSS